MAEIFREGTTQEAPFAETDSFSAEHAGQLLFHAFRFSQGRNTQLEAIIKNLRNYHPSWSLGDEDFEATRRVVVPLVGRFIYPHVVDPSFEKLPEKPKHIPLTYSYNRETEYDVVEPHLEECMKIAREAFSNPPDNNLIPKIAFNMLRSDLKFLLRNGRRPLSYQFALGDKPAGLPEYTKMMSEVAEVIRETGISIDIENPHPREIEEVLNSLHSYDNSATPEKTGERRERSHAVKEAVKATPGVKEAYVFAGGLTIDFQRDPAGPSVFTGDLGNAILRRFPEIGEFPWDSINDCTPEGELF